MELLIVFIVLNIVNVILQTVKSLATVKCGKAVAAIVNAVAYGLYTIVLVYTMCDLPLMWKAGIVALCNFIGVYVVKLIEEKARKDKLWKVEATVKHAYKEEILQKLPFVPYSYIEIGKHDILNFYCATQNESRAVKDVLTFYEAKYFVSESKTL